MARPGRGGAARPAAAAAARASVQAPRRVDTKAGGRVRVKENPNTLDTSVKFVKKGRVKSAPARSKPTIMRRIIDREKLERWVRDTFVLPAVARAVGGRGGGAPAASRERGEHVEWVQRRRPGWVRLCRDAHLQLQDLFVRALALGETEQPADDGRAAADPGGGAATAAAPAAPAQTPGEQYREEVRRSREAAVEGLARARGQGRAGPGEAFEAAVAPAAAVRGRGSSELAAFLEAVHGRRAQSSLRPHPACRQALSERLDRVAEGMLATLAGLQRRMRERNPQMAKMRQRLVCGLREVRKAARAGRARCVVVAPNMAEVRAPGGLDSMLASVLAACAARDGRPTPVVFASTKARLAVATGKAPAQGRRGARSPVTAVAVLDPSGADAELKELLALAAAAREQWAMAACDDFPWTLPERAPEPPAAAGHARLRQELAPDAPEFRPAAATTAALNVNAQEFVWKGL